MTEKELAIFYSQEVDMSEECEGRLGKTYDETARDLGVSGKTIARTKQKPEYNALQIARYEERDYELGSIADDMIALTKATIKDEPQNSVRFLAVNHIAEVFGVKSPKKVDLKHSMASMSDDELINAVDGSLKEIETNGRLKNQLTGSPNAEVVKTNTVPQQESAMACSTGEQAVSATDA
jgi:cell division protein FtsI/penicillin-binding protein 2